MGFWFWFWGFFLFFISVDDSSSVRESLSFWSGFGWASGEFICF